MIWAATKQDLEQAKFFTDWIFSEQVEQLIEVSLAVGAYA